jgi:hypothetical protein
MNDERRYFVGERVLVSRAQDGTGHEEATVVDFYELLVEGDKIPSVVVDFDDGERLYISAREPNVLPIEPEDPEDDDDWDEDEAGEDDDDGEDEEDDVSELDADEAFRGGHVDDEDDEGE